MLLEVHSEFNWKCLVFDTNYCMDFKYWLCATTYYARQEASIKQTIRQWLTDLCET